MHVCSLVRKPTRQTRDLSASPIWYVGALSPYHMVGNTPRPNVTSPVTNAYAVLTDPGCQMTAGQLASLKAPTGMRTAYPRTSSTLDQRTQGDRAVHTRGAWVHRTLKNPRPPAYAVRGRPGGMRTLYPPVDPPGVPGPQGRARAASTLGSTDRQLHSRRTHFTHGYSRTHEPHVTVGSFVSTVCADPCVQTVPRNTPRRSTGNGGGATA